MVPEILCWEKAGLCDVVQADERCKMRVFLSWSGDTSKQVATILREWLPSVIQAVEPFMSAEDVEKGTRWASILSGELEASNAGVVCVTPDSLSSTWLNFEAGALSKIVGQSLVCPYLHGLTAVDLVGPLSMFQASVANKDDTRRLVATLNDALKDRALPEPRLQKAFESYWPELSDRLSAIAAAAPAPKRPERDVLEEILANTRAIMNAESTRWTIEPPGWATTDAGGTSVFDRPLPSSNPFSSGWSRGRTIGEILKPKTREALLRYASSRSNQGKTTPQTNISLTGTGKPKEEEPERGEGGSS